MRRGLSSSSLRNILRRLGPVGTVLEGALDVLGHGRRGRSVDATLIQEAIDLLERSGYTVTPGGVEPPPVGRQQRSRGGGADWPPEHVVDSRARIRDRTDPRGGDLSVWTETPQSSNVYAFSWDKIEGILYVRYKARSDQDPRPHAPGPLYSYGGRGRQVPEAVYRAMLGAASKGKFVWDHLRVRGTLWGHQYQYTLVEPEGASTGGEIYVPRKATRGGLRSRTVVFKPAGANRPRQMVRSTLPARGGRRR